MNKKKAWIAASVLSSLFAAAVYVEGTGYATLDRESGDNLLCKIDPACRHLTPGETTLARKYFNDSINYNSVKIFNRAVMGLFGQNTLGMSPNGNIYFADKEDRFPDFSNKNAYDQKTFIHEMTHVAQHQNGTHVPLQALLTYLTYGYKYDDAYDYRIETNAPFDLMNLEQQAEIMEDYFLERSDFEDKTTFPSQEGPKLRLATQGTEWLKTQCKNLAQYEEKLQQKFPVKPDELCQPNDKARHNLPKSPISAI